LPPTEAKVGLLRRIGRPLLWLSLAGGLAFGAGRAFHYAARPQIDLKAQCDSGLCTLDVWGQSSRFMSKPPRLGPETGCGATIVKTEVINDHWARYILDINGVRPENPCDVLLVVDGRKIKYPSLIAVK